MQALQCTPAVKGFTHICQECRHFLLKATCQHCYKYKTQHYRLETVHFLNLASIKNSSSSNVPLPKIPTINLATKRIAHKASLLHIGALLANGNDYSQACVYFSTSYLEISTVYANELLEKLVLPPEGDGDLITGEGSGDPNGGFLEGLPGVLQRDVVYLG